MPLRIAIIGSGISGLGALWAFNRSENEVHIFEAQDRVGGHTHTVEWTSPQTGKKTMVDLAVVLFNEVTYPNFMNFIRHLGLPTWSSNISFGLTRNDGEFEWSSKSCSGIFAQRRNLFSLSMWRMLFDIVRFNLFATDVLEPSNPYRGDSIGGYLDRNGYSDAFVKDYIIPLTATLWVSDPKRLFALNPAIMIIRFLWNHHLMNSFKRSIQWLRIEGGAIRYVDAILAQTRPERVHVSTKVVRVYNQDNKVMLVFENENVETFDRVIIATHAPQALQLIGQDCTSEEEEILRSFRTSISSVVLHSDLSFMPSNPSAWSTWNYLSTSSASQNVSLTFNMASTSPDSLSTDGHIFTTLNPSRPPHPSTVQAAHSYAHPLYDITVLAQQERMPSIQGRRNIWFAGAWMKYGFHEDGFTAGLEAAMAIAPEIRLPFPVVDSTYSRGLTAGPVAWHLWVLRCVVDLVQIAIVLVTVQAPAFWRFGTDLFAEVRRAPWRSWRSRVGEDEAGAGYIKMSKQML